MVPGTPDRASLYISQQTKETFRNHPLNRGTPLTIKKSKVARIQVCEIRFNRTKASFTASMTRLQSPSQIQTLSGQRRRESNQNHNNLENTDNQHFSRDISLGATNNALNTHGGQQPSMTMLQLNNSKHAGPGVS